MDDKKFQNFLNDLRKINHDIRQPLFVILAYTDMIKEDLYNVNSDKLIPRIIELNKGAKKLNERLEDLSFLINKIKKESYTSDSLKD